VESGEYHIHVDIFDTFPGLYEDDALLARMGTTHPIFIPEIAFPLGLKWNQVGSQKPPYLLRHSGGVESGNSKQQHLDRLALIRAFQSAGIEINLRATIQGAAQRRSQRLGHQCTRAQDKEDPEKERCIIAADGS
jgi:hypothetical protein